MFEQTNEVSRNEADKIQESDAKFESLRAEAHSVINEWQNAYNLLESELSVIKQENNDLHAKLELYESKELQNAHVQETYYFTEDSEQHVKEVGVLAHIETLETIENSHEENSRKEQIPELQISGVCKMSNRLQENVNNLPQEEMLISRELYLRCKEENELLLNEHERLVLQIELQEKQWEQFLQTWMEEVVSVERTIREFIEENFDGVTSLISKLLHELYQFDRRSMEFIESINERCAVLTEKLKQNEESRLELEEEKLELQELSMQQLNLISNYEKEKNDLFNQEKERRNTINELEAKIQQLCSENCSFVNKLQETEIEAHVLKETCTSTLLELNTQKELYRCEMEEFKTMFENEQKCKAAEMQIKTEECNLLEHINMEKTQLLRQKELEVLCCEEICSRNYIYCNYYIILQEITLQERNSFTVRAKEHLDSCISQHGLTVKNCEEEYTNCSKELTRVIDKCAEQEIEIRRLEEQVNELTTSNALLEANINTENDKCSELNIRNAWLKEQVESMREELTELESAFNVNLHSLREEHEMIEQENNELKNKLRDVQDQLETKEACIAETEFQNVQLSEKVALLELALRTMDDKVKSIQSKTIKYQTLLKQKEQQAEESAKDCTEWRNCKEHLTDKIQAYEELINTITNTYTVKLNEYKRKIEEEHLSLSKFESVNVNLREEILSCSEENKELRNKVELLESQVNNLRESVKVEATKKVNWEEVVRKLTSERDSINTERDKLLQEQTRLHAIINNLESEYKDKFTNQLMLLITLSEKQEHQLEQLRRKCAFSGKVLKMFISSTEHTESSTFTKEINLIEGPIRHPKKRTKL